MPLLKTWMLFGCIPWYALFAKQVAWNWTRAHLCGSFPSPARICVLNIFCSFLDHILRIADPLYVPTNGEIGSYHHCSTCSICSSRLAEDILAVRLRSLGIAQHTFDVSHTGTTYSWVLYDVGGAVRPHGSLTALCSTLNAPAARSTTVVDSIL